MKPTSIENAIRIQFDFLIKKATDHTVKDYEKVLGRRAKKETPFSDLPDIVVESFAVFDDYELDVTVFDVYGM